MATKKVTDEQVETGPSEEELAMRAARKKEVDDAKAVLQRQWMNGVEQQPSDGSPERAGTILAQILSDTDGKLPLAVLSAIELAKMVCENVVVYGKGDEAIPPDVSDKMWQKIRFLQIAESNGRQLYKANVDSL